MCLLCCAPSPLLSSGPQVHASYPRVAPKPSLPCVATGGPRHGDAAQGSPAVMRKTVPVQSSRPPPTASAQQGERRLSRGSCVVFCRLRWTNVLAGPPAADAGFYPSAPAPPEQMAPAAGRDERRQPAAFGAPPARQQPPPPEEEEGANDYDSDEASEDNFNVCALSFQIWGPGRAQKRS